MLGIFYMLREAQKPAHQPAGRRLFLLRGAFVFERVGEVLQETDQDARCLLPSQRVDARDDRVGFQFPRRIAGKRLDNRGFTDQIRLQRGEARTAGCLLRTGTRRQLLLGAAAE
jgi:hypothetical protein